MATAAAVEEAAAQGEQPKKKKLSGKKLVLFIVLPVLLLGGGGAAAYFLLFKKAPPTAEEQAAAAAAAEAAPGVYVEIPKIEANLESTSKRGNYLSLSLWLEVKDDADSKKLPDVMPRIIDQFQVYLRSLRIDDLQGSDGVQRMRDELLMRARAAAKPIEIKDVLIKAMLAQ
ncbi:MAG TPA: flagellar basal body-associated FliL family protein [Candidatus Cybelea sp.]|nr:flagellar basal body-associated FliL family protein [Candidatus Cybelea sp.]